MQQFLIEYCNSCFNTLISNILRTKIKCSRSNVHNLRLSIKKIDTIVSILNSTSPLLVGDKTLQKFQRIYNYSGALRNTQIAKLLLKSISDSRESEARIVAKSIKKERKKASKKLAKKVLKLNHFEIVLFQQRINEAIEKIDKIDLEEVCNLQVKRLTSLISESISEIDEESYHSTRINIKDLLSIQKLLKAYRPDNQYPLSNYKLLDKIQSQIGKWHDLTILKCLIDNKYQTTIGTIDDKRSILKKKIVRNLSRINAI